MKVEIAPSVLVVDDDDIYRERLVRALRDRGFEAEGAADGDLALNLAQVECPEYAIVDLRMPGRSGLEVVEGLLAIDPGVRVLVLTGYGSIATAVRATRLGAIDYLGKPADVDQILAALLGEGGEAAPEEPQAPSLARVEWEHIHRVLQDCEGNVSQAARVLGIHRRSLQRKLAKLPTSH